MIQLNKKNIPVLYLLFYRFFKDKSTKRIFIPYSLAKETLTRNVHNIPRKYYYLILEEMEELGLLRKIGTKRNFKYEFIGKDIDKHLNKYEDLF